MERNSYIGYGALAGLGWSLPASAVASRHAQPVNRLGFSLTASDGRIAPETGYSSPSHFCNLPAHVAAASSPWGVATSLVAVVGEDAAALVAAFCCQNSFNASISP